MSSESAHFLRPHDTFVRRHIGPDAQETAAMLATLGLDSLEALVQRTVPASIRSKEPLDIGPERGERELLLELKQTASKNRVLRSLLGLGYHDCIVPPVIQRNILENPGWYTQYTPYQAEISQGRLEALLNFQTMVSDLCGLPLANSSLLDEATACAEALNLCRSARRAKSGVYFVSEGVHPQTLAVVKTRAEAAGMEVVVGDPEQYSFEGQGIVGALVQYPRTDGQLWDVAPVAERIHAAGAKLVVSTDLLALCLATPPGELGADIAVGNSQRFGVPMGYGGPHAAFLAAADEFKRSLPGRIIGVSKDVHGAPALRMAMQTREQHIRREKATSNICTAQVLLAVMAGAYAVYHGPEGLRAIAERVHGHTRLLQQALEAAGCPVEGGSYFDTLLAKPAGGAEQAIAKALAAGINLRGVDAERVLVALDEKTDLAEVATLVEALTGKRPQDAELERLGLGIQPQVDAAFRRSSDYLTHPVFKRYRSEHEMLRYLHRLQARDLSLTTSMIALGSCTMKLNGTSEMLPVTWPEFGDLHPFAPRDQAQGYDELFDNLNAALCEITGFDAFSLQPNAGSQGEYAGLLVIRAWHQSRQDTDRKVCLIPTSAHGTNPASAVMAGFEVVPVACDERGNIDLEDLRKKSEQHADRLGALMVTYPSTHGVFEEEIRSICEIVHSFGGQVYMDGANMNAQVGLCRPGQFGADVCHLNLHKTFCIPHGGGGPGMGPIGVRSHLAPFLPGHPLTDTGGESGIGPVSAAPWGSPSILPISWVYIALMGGAGLTRATEIAILSANYMSKRLEEHYDVLYRGAQGQCAHEFIIDLRAFEKSADVHAEDVAKRLMDYGFHAPTMSFPVAGTLMIEPTESETRAELDRLCDALIQIRSEIGKIEAAVWTREDNPLCNAPHTAAVVTAQDWDHPYTREEAAFPAPWTREQKFWPAVGRIDNGYGDKNLICTCPPMEAYAN